MSIIVGVGSPGTVASASGGKVYAYNNVPEASEIVVAPKNASRRQITFHNPGANDIFIAPSFIQNTIGTVPSSSNGQPQLTDTALNPSNAALGGCYRVYGNGGTLIISGECQGAWQAFAVTGAGASNPLTVIDSNT